MPTLICFALKEEATPFQKIAACKSEISIHLTGIGRQNAEKSIREFLAGGASVLASHLQIDSPDQARLARILAPPDLVLTCGFTGGLNPDLKPGEVVFETSDENLRNKLISAGAKPVKFFCADRIATTASEKKKLRLETGADVVEMESAAIQTICRERDISCATVRVISDTAEEELPLDFNQLAKPDMNLDYGKLAWAIMKSPGKIGALMRLQKRCRFAAERLAEILEKVIQR